MTEHHDLDEQLNAFLREGPTDLPDMSFDAVRDRTELIRQRVVIGPWRLPEMNKFVTIGLGAAAVVVVLFVGAQLFGSPTGGLGGPGGGSTPTPEPTGTIPEPSGAEPTRSAGAFGPESQLLVWDSAFEDAPSIWMTVAAPGWSQSLEFGLLSKGDEVDNVPEAWLISGSFPPRSGVYVYGDPCRWESTTPETPATTVDEIVAALGAQPDRDASEPMDVTVGAYAGKMISLRVPDGTDVAACDGEKYASYAVPDLGEGPWEWHQGPGQIDDFWFIDVEGSVVEFRVAYRPDTPPELVAEMRTMIESATFEFP